MGRKALNRRPRRERSAAKFALHEYSQQRSRFATELEGQARSLGEPDPETSSTTAGALHRAWITLKSAVTRGDDHAILAQCERGEDSAVEEYEKAMADNLSAPLREIVARQYAEIKNTHDRVKNLRDVPDNLAKTNLIEMSRRFRIREDLDTSQ